MRGLKDKRILVTGGASGIGAATARRFLDEGARVVVLDIDRLRCRQLERELPGLTGTIVADVTDPDAVSTAFAELNQLCQGLDVLINNAGISIRHSFVDITFQEWQRQKYESMKFVTAQPLLKIEFKTFKHACW